MILDIYGLLDKACRECNADAVALSGGLDSTIIAYMIRERSPQGISVISKDFVATDLTYCQMAASRLDIGTRIVQPDTPQILEAISECIGILGNFNNIEIRNSAVMYLAIKAAKEMGSHSLVTGDGADEIFAGYDFLCRISHDRLATELRRIRSVMHFTSADMGKHMGIKIESPFLDPDLLEAAANIRPEMLIGMHNGARMGKMILRHLFKDRIPHQIAWRAKSPMQDGAGTSGLIGMLDALMPGDIFDERVKCIQESDGIRIRTKESLFYYEEYRKRFSVPIAAPSDRRSCRYCKYALSDNSNFCRMCGAFPA